MIKNKSIRFKLNLFIVISLTMVLTLATLLTVNLLFRKELAGIFQDETEKKVEFLNLYLESHLAAQPYLRHPRQRPTAQQRS